MSFGWRLKKPKRECLVFGWNRTNSSMIPSEICMLCLLFYDSIIDWTLRDAALDQFFKCKGIESLQGPEFKIRDIPIRLELFPNGRLVRFSGYVDFIFRVLTEEITHLIASFDIYFELFCFETKYQFRKSMTIDTDSGYFCQWYRYSVRLKKLKQMKVTELNFGCFVEILNIKYRKDQYRIKSYIRPIWMNVNYKYEWDLDDEEMDIFKSSRVDSSLYSNNFNHKCWCIVLVPNGWSYHEEGIGHLFAKVKLLRLPFGVKSMDIETQWIIKSENKSVQWKYSKKCDYIFPGTVDMDRRIKGDQFKMFANHLKIIVSMKIVKVYDNDDIEIEKEKWNDYGLLNE